MSIPFDRIPQTTSIGLNDTVFVNQGSPAVTRRTTWRNVLAATTTSTGPVGTQPDVYDSPIYLSQLPYTDTVYLNDTMLVNQGSPPITRQATVQQIITTTNTSTPTNTELVLPIVDKVASGVPVASAAYLSDWLLVNPARSNPVKTYRCQLENAYASGGQSQDPCAAEVVLLVQNGILTDLSTYGRTLTISGTTVSATPVADSDFPSGQGRTITGQHLNGGIQLANGPELTFGTNPVCFEVFFKCYGFNGGAQVFYTDGYGFNGNTWVGGGPVFAGDAKPDIRVNGDLGHPPVGAPLLSVNTMYYIVTQINTDRTIHYWIGDVASGIATKYDSASSSPSPIVQPSPVAPAIGEVGGSGGVNNFIFDQMRITLCERYSASTIAIPTAVFPVP